MRKRILALARGDLAHLAASAAALAALAWRELNTPLPIAAEGDWLRVPSGTPLRACDGRARGPGPARQTLAARLVRTHDGRSDAHSRRRVSASAGNDAADAAREARGGRRLSPPDHDRRRLALQRSARRAPHTCRRRSDRSRRRRHHERARRPRRSSGRAVLSRHVSVSATGRRTSRFCASRTTPSLRGSRMPGATAAQS